MWQRERLSQRKRQLFKRRERRQKEKSIECVLMKEQEDITNMTWWTEASVLNMIETTYGFVADHKKPNGTMQHNI